jgi:hypothetical protein
MPPIDDPMIGAVGTSDDLLAFASLDMIERQRDADLGINAETEAEPIRTLNNTLDFLGHVADEVVDLVAHGDDRMQPAPEPPFVMNTYNTPGHTWKATRYRVSDTVIQCARKNEQRMTFEIVNLGPGVVYVSDESSGGFGAVENTKSIPISILDGVTGNYNPVRIDTQDEIWLRSATGGAVPAVVECVETFGAPERRAV